MANRHIDTLLPILVLAGISFLLAWGLFEVLKSTAEVKGPWYNLGGGIAEFFVVLVFLYNWHNKLDVRRSEDFAIEIARLTAISIVKEGGNNRSDLNTSYNDEFDGLEDLFERQDKKWKKLLFKELEKQTKLKARENYRELRDWSPTRQKQPTVEDIVR